jgi:chromosome segregation ATPase
MEQFQLLKNDSERLNNDILRQKSEQINLHNELQQLEQQFDDNKDELTKTKQELLINKNKYENIINQINQSFEKLQNEKHSIENQFKNFQSQFIDKTNQYEQLQTNFNQLTIEKDEQLSEYKKNLNQQQILNDNLRRELNDLHDELKSKLSLQTNFDKLQQTFAIKIEQFSQEKQTLNERHKALEEKFNNILSEKAGLENQLDKIRVQIQTTEINIKTKKQDELEQSAKRIQELQVIYSLSRQKFSKTRVHT